MQTFYATASFICLFLVHCSVGAAPLNGLQEEQLVQGIPCGGNVEYHSNGKIKSCILSRDYTVEGYLLPHASKVFFGPGGELDQCRLGDSAGICGQVFPVGSTIFFNHWGQKVSFWLRSNTVIQGHEISATDDGIGNSMYPTGKLKAIWLADDQDIEGVPCTSSGNIFRFGFSVLHLGTRRMAWFHENGRLRQAMLSRDITIQGHSFSKGDIVSFDTNGKIDLGASKLE
jgi:hypothetical protein